MWEISKIFYSIKHLFAHYKQVYSSGICLNKHHIGECPDVDSVSVNSDLMVKPSIPVQHMDFSYGQSSISGV